MERLADLDELVLRCRTEQAKEYVREAVASYRSGAYRAAITTTWIAVVYDIVDKIREIELTGDINAKSFIRDFENIQTAYRQVDPDALKRSLEFERTIIDKAHGTFELFSTNEKRDLERLKEDRNRCAHPTMNLPDEPYRPTAELARLHLRSAMAHVLSQSPVQGRMALERVTKEIAGEYFPTNSEDAQAALSEGPMARPRAKLIDLVINACVSEFLAAGISDQHRLRHVAAINALRHLHPELTERALERAVKRVCRGAENREIKLLAQLAIRIGAVWGYLMGGTKTKIGNYVREDPDVVRKSFFPQMDNIEMLCPIVRERIKNLNEDDLAEVIKSGGHDIAIERSVELFCNVRSWLRANAVFELLIEPIIQRMTIEHIEQIIQARRVNHADLLGSAGFNRFVEKIRERNDLDQSKFEAILKEENLTRYFRDDDPLDESGTD